MVFLKNTILHQGVLLKHKDIGLVKLSRFDRFDLNERGRERVKEEKKGLHARSLIRARCVRV